jgi:hypothetical protein
MNEIFDEENQRRCRREIFEEGNIERRITVMSSLNEMSTDKLERGRRYSARAPPPRFTAGFWTATPPCHPFTAG